MFFLVIASHIVPWCEDKTNRLNPSNGLCLSAIHDKAFDSLLFALTNDWHVVLSEQIKSTTDAFLRTVFWHIDDKQIELPERFRPDPVLVKMHRSRMLATSMKG